MKLSRSKRLAEIPPVRAARWFLEDCVRRFRTRLALITFLGLGAAGLQGGAITLLGWAISSGQTPETASLPTIGRVPLNLPEIAVIIIVALLISAILTFVQGRQVLKLWRAYQLHSVNQVLSSVQHAVARGIDREEIERSPALSVMRQSLRLGAFTRIVGSSISPLLRFFVFSAVAIGLAPGLTLLIVLVAVPSTGLALMYFARKSSRAARRVEELGRPVSVELKDLLARSVQGDQAASIRDQGPGISAFVDRTKALTDRILYVEQARMTGWLVAIVSLGGFVGYTLLETPEGAASTFIYALALVLAFRQLISVVTSISSFGRFYPFVQAQWELLESLRSASSSQDFREKLARSSIGKAVAGKDLDIDEEL